MWILDSGDASYHSKEAISMHHDFGTFLQNELCLLHSCSTFVDDFVDVQAQAAYSACYILWLKVVCGLVFLWIYFLRLLSCTAFSGVLHVLYASANRQASGE